ncbi:Beta-1-3-galactosyltransferase 1-like 1, partial [Homarus americanus]
MRKFWILSLAVITYLLFSYTNIFKVLKAGLRRGEADNTYDGFYFSNTEVDLGYRKRHGGQEWREIVGSWNHHYQVKSQIEGDVVNTYPDEVTFLVEESEACRDPPLVLAMVVTAVTNWHRRHFIRHTWGHPALVQVTGVKPLFVMGQVNDKKHQDSVMRESQQHHDVVQANFIDSYRNLTYKTMALLTWAAQHCPLAPVILKIDDDVILNPVALREFLLVYLQEHPQPTRIMGKVRCCDPVLRKGKWGVPEDIYPKKGYPTYVAGPSYIVPTPIIPTLLQAIKRTKFFFLEDVYTTGLAAKTSGVHHYNIFSLTNSFASKMDYYWCSGARVFQ